MTAEHRYHPDTLCLHAGQEPDPATGARAVPIYQTTSYVFKGTDQAAAPLRAHGGGPHLYPDLQPDGRRRRDGGSPPSRAGVGGLLVASGMAAELIIFSVLAKQGDNIVSSSTLYGGTKTILSVSLPRFGISGQVLRRPEAGDRRGPDRRPDEGPVRRDHRQPGRRRRRPGSVRPHRPRPRRPARRGQHVRRLPLPADRMGGRHRLPFRHQVHRRPRHVDRGDHRGRRERFPGATGASPNSSIRPRATTVSSSWRPSRKRPSSSSAAWTASGRSGPPPRPSTRSSSSRDSKRFTCGSRGTARTPGGWPATSPAIPRSAWVSYAGLPGHPSHELARKYLKGGFGSIFTFGVKGGIEAGKKVIEGVRLISHLANVGRRQDPHPPPGLDVAFPAFRRRPARGRGHARPRPAVGRHRVRGRHHRRPRPGPGPDLMAPGGMTWTHRSVGIVEKTIRHVRRAARRDAARRAAPPWARSPWPTRPTAGSTTRSPTPSWSATPCREARTRPAIIPRPTRSRAGGTTWSGQQYET